MKLALIVGLTFLAGPLWAQNFYNGNQLYEECTQRVPNDCRAYIIGVIDTLMAFQERNVLKRVVCLPHAATQGQLRDVVVKYLQVSPESRHFTGNALVYVALQQAFPCPEAKP